MKRFKVAFDLSEEQFINLLRAGGSLFDEAKIAVIDDQNYDKPGAFSVSPNRPPSPRAPRQQTTDSAPRQRKLRGSKVNDTVIGRLQQGGPSHKKDLEEALVAAGCAAGSLSTALSVLQKRGQVKRLGDGMYGLAEAA